MRRIILLLAVILGIITISLFIILSACVIANVTGEDNMICNYPRI